MVNRETGQLRRLASRRGATLRVVAPVLLALGLPAVRAAETPLAAARSGIEQWVQTRQLISRTRSDWERDRDLLMQTRALHERELEGIAERFSRISTNITQVDRDLEAARAEASGAEMALNGARELAAGFEGRVRQLLPRLPAALLQQLDPLVKRLPKDEAAAAKTPPGERLQTVVGILNEIDKFNGSVTVVSEIQKNPAGAEVQVEVVYLGLGQAWFVDTAGGYGGVGLPGAAGWEWQAKPDSGTAIRSAIAAYREADPPSFIGLPVEIR